MEITLAQLMRELCDTIAPETGDREAVAVSREIMRGIKGWDLTQLAIRSADPVSDFTADKARDAARRVAAGEPVQYIFGQADFYGTRLRVTPATLIPRPETAELVDLIVKRYGGTKDLRVLDAGTGSGCIAIALARNLPFARVDAIDISAEALEVARGNAAALHAAVDFRQADMLALPRETDRYDIIASNPPYIADSERAAMERNVLDHEPPGALFVPDDDPLRFYAALLGYASAALAPDGRVYFEINPLYADRFATLARSNGFADTEILPDTQGRPRFAVIHR